jgi:predicted ATP-dependent protease
VAPGKELVARAIHESSPRRDRALIKVNCGAVPETLFESEFFGHVKGSFTGAMRDKPGRFELADGGTLFLDEIGEVPLPMQAKLLRVLQEQEIERVGDTRTRKLNVRIVAATNRDLKKEVKPAVSGRICFIGSVCSRLKSRRYASVETTSRRSPRTFSERRQTHEPSRPALHHRPRCPAQRARLAG